MFLQAPQNAKRVGNYVSAKLCRIWRAGSLFFRCTCQETSLLRGPFLFVNRECRGGEDWHQDEECADFEVHCQMPWFRALFGDNRRSNSTFYEEFVKSEAVD